MEYRPRRQRGSTPAVDFRWPQALVVNGLAKPRKPFVAVVLCVLFAAGQANAQAAPPAAHSDVAFDFMNLLSQHGFHNLADERRNAYGQFTYITNFKLPFQAPYTNANGSTNSLIPGFEQSFTASFTLFLVHGCGEAQRPTSSLK